MQQILQTMTWSWNLLRILIFTWKLNKMQFLWNSKPKLIVKYATRSSWVSTSNSTKGVICKRRNISVKNVKKDSTCLMTSKDTIAFIQGNGHSSVKNVRKDLEWSNTWRLTLWSTKASSPINVTHVKKISPSSQTSRDTWPGMMMVNINVTHVVVSFPAVKIWKDTGNKYIWVIRNTLVKYVARFLHPSLTWTNTFQFSMKGKETFDASFVKKVLEDQAIWKSTRRSSMVMFDHFLAVFVSRPSNASILLKNTR